MPDHPGPDRRPARAAQRSVEPRSLVASALWGGVGSALAGAVVCIAAVAVLWLPASGGSGSAGSALRAGALTFLAALHGGITVDGSPSNLVPLGMTTLVGLLAWRIGTSLADSADELGQDRPGALLGAAAVQAAAFAATCGVLAALATLGSSHVSPLAATLAGFVLFASTGGTALVRRSPVGDHWRAARPAWWPPAFRCTLAVVAVYLAAGSLLVAGSLIAHRDQVMALSAQVGGGLSGLPVLVFGLLAVPNAAVAAAGYLTGPGFAVGAGTTFSLTATAHGTVPAFPLLAALPRGDGAGVAVWILAVATPLVAGGYVAVLARRAATPRAQWRDAGAGIVGAGVVAALLAWLGGGGIGAGRLAVVGVSSWLLALAVIAVVAVTSALALGVFTAADVVQGRGRTVGPASLRMTPRAAADDSADAIAERMGVLNDDALNDDALNDDALNDDALDDDAADGATDVAGLDDQPDFDNDDLDDEVPAAGAQGTGADDPDSGNGRKLAG